jgi:hypothetical protein
MGNIEKLSRSMTAGDPDRLVPVAYGKVVGYHEGGPPRYVLQTDMVLAWKLHEAAARAILSRRASETIARILQKRSSR